MALRLQVFCLFISIICVAVALNKSFAASVSRSTLISGDSLKITELVRSADSLKNINYKLASSFARQGVELARSSGSAYLLERALAKKALLDWYNGDHKQALANCFEGLELANQLGDSVAIASRLTQIGLVYLYTSDYDSALKYNELALDRYLALKDTTRILKIYGFTGLVYDHQADYVNAKKNLLAAAIIKRRFKTADWSVLQLPERNGPNRYYYEESLLNAKKNLAQYNSKALPSSDLKNIFENLGIAYNRLGYADSALVYFKKSADLAIQIGMDVYWNELAESYTALGEYDSAIMATQKALNDAIDHGTRINQLSSYQALGESYKAMGYYQMAVSLFQKSLSLDQKMGHRYSQMKIMAWISECALAMNNVSSSIAYADSSLAIAREIGANEGIINALNLRYQGFDHLHDYKKALAIKKTHDILRDSLFESKIELELAKLDLFYEVELKNAEITELNRQQLLSEALLKNRTLTMIIGLIVGFFVVLLFLLYYVRALKLSRLNQKLNRQQNVITRQNSALNKSNKEKEILLGEIHHRVKNNLQVISSLLSIQGSQLTDDTAKAAVWDSQKRVQTMGFIHESLYQTENFSNIDMQAYFEKLATNLAFSFGYNADEISLAVNAKDIDLDVDTAINMGLISNELIMNALKHGLSKAGNDKRIEIYMGYESNECLTLRITNSGGTENIEQASTKASFGLMLVKQIIKKYNGTFAIISGKDTQVSLCLNVTKLTNEHY